MSTKFEEFSPIWFGCIFWHEIAEKTYSTYAVEEVLKHHITLSDYGTGIKAIRFVTVAVRPTNKIHEEGMEYKSRKKELYINAKLKYEEVEKAPLEDIPKMIAMAFVDRIEQYEDAGVKNFDTVRFKQDVETLFAGEGWLIPQDQDS